jgi:bifunctional non-homologous end joining protein LigD
MADKTITVDGRTLDLSNTDKVFFPEDKITKGEIIDYYRRIAEVMLPHTKDRPISMQRFPDGIEKNGFYEKIVPDHFPQWIERVTVELKEGKGSQLQIVCNNAATLAYLADQACLTPHIWLSRRDKLNYPDRIVFDLDPPGDDFEVVRSAAHILGEMLEEIGLMAFVLLTGSKGLHLTVPLRRSADFETVRTFARDLVELIARRNPERFTTQTRKEKRKGRLFLDYLRNGYGQTTVAPYAVRAKPGAPLATPIDWDELKDRNLHSATYSTSNIFRRLGQREDPWKDVRRHARTLNKPRRQLDKLLKKA